MNLKIERTLQFFEQTLVEHYNAKVPRQEQVNLAMDVLDYMLNKDKTILFLEAPVGTGKSLGVLVPVLQNLRKNKYKEESIIYATATINLQHQLINSEAKLLKKFRILKKEPLLAIGKNHYACVTLYKRNRHQFSDSKQRKLDLFFRKSNSNFDFELSEFKISLTDDEWKLISLDNISGSSCRFGANCHGHQQRRKYYDDIPLKITNHSQLIQSYLNYKREKLSVLPLDPGVIIFDEGHLLQENFMSALEVLLNPKKMRKLKLTTSSQYYALVENVDRIINNLKIKSKQENKSGRVELPPELYTDFEKILDILRYIDDTHTSSIFDDLYFFLVKIVNKKSFVSWYDISDGMLHVIPNNYKQQLSDFLNFLRLKNKVIVMSGTLTADHDDDEIDYKWGMTPNTAIYYNYGQSFDYKHQAIVYIPKNLAAPSSINDEHIQQVESIILKVHESIKTGILILNSSKLYMNEIAIFLKENIVNREIFLQGDASVSTLTKLFTDKKDSILVGSGSFNSGLSVTGQSLSTVIITKLPFPVPDDPIIQFQAKNMSQPEAMKNVIIPEMIATLRQGMGRLIRTSTDYGVIIITDSRLWNMPYGQKILNIISDEGYNVTDSFDEAINFITNIDSNHGKPKIKTPTYTRENAYLDF